MIWVTIMLFMIGQKLDMPTAYWVMWGLYIFCHTVSVLISVVKKALGIEERFVARETGPEMVGCIRDKK